jgi:hypothetical protein
VASGRMHKVIAAVVLPVSLISRQSAIGPVPTSRSVRTNADHGLVTAMRPAGPIPASGGCFSGASSLYFFGLRMSARFLTPRSGALLLPNALLVPDELYIAPDLKINGVIGDDATRRRLEELTKTKTEKILRLSTNDPNQAQLLWADIDAIDGELKRDFGSVEFWLKGGGGSGENNPWLSASSGKAAKSEMFSVGNAKD